MTYKDVTRLGLTLLLPAVFLSPQAGAKVGSGVSAPSNGVILSGTGVNPKTGQHFRHHWAGSAGNGFCRLDPDVDTGGLIGPYTLNTSTCITSGSAGFTPGPVSFDP